ncbi:DUF317 domain-containing protein [Streptomyces anulatus]|uniref:DUF317 domain-containing protein n=2 Tax=Streptomyces anulatus TaxID=1892 RepID=UPI0035DC277D
MTVPSPTETVEVSFITPRHLAGGGDPAWITVPLHRACGWSYEHDPLMPRVVLSSLNETAVLRLEPDADRRWWSLHHAADRDRPAWYASFGARTPVEVIAGFIDALTDPASSRPAPSDPYEPLRQRAWSPTHGTAPGLVAPDGNVFVQRLGEEHDPGAWFVTATLGPSRPVWQARFDRHTPVHLVSAFTTALADPQPVLRTNGPLDLPTLDPKIISRRFVDVPEAFVPACIVDRVLLLAARHDIPPADPSPPGPPPPRTSRSR